MPEAYISCYGKSRARAWDHSRVSSADSAHSTTSLDDERVRVTTWTFAADGGGPATLVEIELKT